jgi:chaperonin GroEL
MNFSDPNGLPTTKVIFSDEARKQLYQGLNVAAEAVGCTLGPKGKTVLIQRDGQAPLVTKDGVTVSKSIRLKDPVQRMGAELIQESASQTNEVAGDGTTTATVLTQVMVKEGLKLLEAGFSAKELCSGIERARNRVDAELALAAKQLTTSAEIAQVGTISANGDALIGQLIAQAMDKVGRDGIITVEDAKGMATTLEVVEGMQFDRGYLSPYFVTNPERMVATYQDALVLVTDKKLSSLRELIPMLEQVVQMQKALLIIADDVEGEALQGLVLNRVKSNLPVVAIKAPGFGQHRDELLNDVCVLTGATLVSSATGVGLQQAAQHLGKVKKFVVDARSTTLVGAGATKDNVDKHVADLRMQLEDVTLGTEEVAKLKTRVAKLASGVAVVRVGGATEVEMVERKYRIEDALNATRAAAEEGIVPGGGMALVNAYRVLDGEQAGTVPAEEKMGAAVVMKACLAPLRRIVENAGQSADVVLKELERQPGMGYNAATGTYEDLIGSGVVDPVKVTRTALKHAASVAVTFLSLDAVVCEEKEDAKRTD